MNIVLMQIKFSPEEISPLLKEFPEFLFLSLNEQTCKELDQEHWVRVEIFLGSSLSKEELQLATHLKWIHVPNDDLSNLCLEEINERGNILVTLTENPNFNETADFAIACIFAFAKQLFHWKDAAKFPALLWEAKWRESMWDFKHKTLLQVGLNQTGLAIAEKAQMLGIRVIGLHSKKTFHPFCNKTLSYKDLNSVIPIADIVVLTLPKQKQYDQFFGKEELELMKNDSILIVLESNKVIDETSLAQVAKTKFRGVAIDTYRGTPLSIHSPLYTIPTVIICPDVAALPENKQLSTYHNFRHNLRNYLHGNFTDLATLYEKKPLVKKSHKSLQK